MKKIFIGGVMVLLPVVILAAAFKWLFALITNWIQPLTNLVVADNRLPELVGDLIVIAIILVLCFVVGTLVSTRIGAWAHRLFDRYLLKLAPGYRMVKEVIAQFFGDASKSPFANGEVARVKIFGPQCPTSVTAIVTSRHDSGDFTVFVPTGPNPTSGNMYHLKPDQVELRPDIKLEDMMRTIIACGAGSGDLYKS
ncbi:DUF502 domain-containing protein [Porticoccus sp. W117]|uniref:DUF502 domain-containing protein n=1 Tax=Porticoccus sp. W117 TaxID=3054777 RepID=UPI002593D7FE|nr:DUF502 domain-containing protein [Porticoccus sp. W117]MDM3870326.1 DUF502 domain-containing protein [Porticoccus sp. W117]